MQKTTGVTSPEGEAVVVSLVCVPDPFLSIAAYLSAKSTPVIISPPFLFVGFWKETLLLALMMTMMYCRTCWFLLFTQLSSARFGSVRFGLVWFGSKQIKINQEDKAGMQLRMPGCLAASMPGCLLP